MLIRFMNWELYPDDGKSNITSIFNLSTTLMYRFNSAVTNLAAASTHDSLMEVGDGTVEIQK